LLILDSDLSGGGAGDQGQEFFGAGAHQVFVGAGFDVESDDRFSVRGSQVEAPVGVFDADTVGFVDTDGTGGVAAAHGGEQSFGIIDAAVDFAARREFCLPFSDELAEVFDTMAGSPE